MILHVVDGTYELFRHFYGLRRFNKGKDRPFGAGVAASCAGGVAEAEVAASYSHAQPTTGARLRSANPATTVSFVVSWVIALPCGLQRVEICAVQA